MDTDHHTQLVKGERFEFGANWQKYLEDISEERILRAEKSLQEMLGSSDCRGKTFLDAGSGSGLFSLAARRLGAKVRSFDYDPASVACTRELKHRYYTDDQDWIIEEGSVLDSEYLDGLGNYDIVYSWGVLHHTGDMWEALANIEKRVVKSGLLFIAIYNDQGISSRYWLAVKRIYNKYPMLRWPLIILHLPYPFLATKIYRVLTVRAEEERGMSFWYDLKDWLGGYPFEVASAEGIFEFLSHRGFLLKKLKTTNRWGCNQFVFIKI